MDDILFSKLPVWFRIHEIIDIQTDLAIRDISAVSSNGGDLSTNGQPITILSLLGVRKGSIFRRRIDGFLDGDGGLGRLLSRGGGDVDRAGLDRSDAQGVGVLTGDGDVLVLGDGPVDDRGLALVDGDRGGQGLGLATGGEGESVRIELDLRDDGLNGFGGDFLVIGLDLEGEIDLGLAFEGFLGRLVGLLGLQGDAQGILLEGEGVDAIGRGGDRIDRESARGIGDIEISQEGIGSEGGGVIQGEDLALEVGSLGRRVLEDDVIGEGDRSARIVEDDIQRRALELFRDDDRSHFRLRVVREGDVEVLASFRQERAADCQTRTDDSQGSQGREKDGRTDSSSSVHCFPS